MIAVQLTDSSGRILGNLRLPSHLSLADLERLALSAGSPLPEDHIEQPLAAEAHARTLETVEVAL